MLKKMIEVGFSKTSRCFATDPKISLFVQKIKQNALPLGVPMVNADLFLW